MIKFIKGVFAAIVKAQELLCPSLAVKQPNRRRTTRYWVIATILYVVYDSSLVKPKSNKMNDKLDDAAVHEI
jgi:hypothetical protein